MICVHLASGLASAASLSILEEGVPDEPPIDGSDPAATTARRGHGGGGAAAPAAAVARPPRPPSAPPLADQLVGTPRLVGATGAAAGGAGGGAGAPEYQHSRFFEEQLDAFQV